MIEQTTRCVRKEQPDTSNRMYPDPGSAPQIDELQYRLQDGRSAGERTRSASTTLLRRAVAEVWAQAAGLGGLDADVFPLSLRTRCWIGESATKLARLVCDGRAARPSHPSPYLSSASTVP